MADKICGDGIGNSTGRLYGAEVELITPNTMYGSSPGEPRTPVQPVDSGGPKKKPTSFQITSVTVQGSRLSNDGGDESADDLDESHTEDLSSDVLDVSKNADQLSPTDENGAADEPPAAAGAPTAGDASSGVPSLPPPTAATTVGAALTIVAGTPASAAPEVPVSPDHWQRRFKVVKIVSSEPFGRGRWLCMDFVDPPAMQGDAKPGDERESAAAGGADLPPAASNEAVAHVYEIPVGQTFPANSQQGGPLYGIILPVSSSAQGPPLGVLQPIAEQPVVTDAPGPGEADPAEPVPENKSTAEEDSESTSAGSTVAIDNKIEQAMDLVKSHLMFAVREEVDVLKEKITELLDRISQLEYENGILRAGASPETLGLLAQPPPQQPALAGQQPTPALPQPAPAAGPQPTLQPAAAPQPTAGQQLATAPQPAPVPQPAAGPQQQAVTLPQVAATPQQPQQQQSLPPLPT